MVFMVVADKYIHRLVVRDKIKYSTIGVCPIVEYQYAIIQLNDKAIVPNICD